jgi:hypothetical protein
MLSGDYEASITYRFFLLNIDGDPISSWSVSALARREADMQHNAAIEIGEVTDAAMRAAANKFMKGLHDRPEVREWLKHRTLTAKAHSTPDEKMVSATNAPEEIRVNSDTGLSTWHDYRTDRPLQLQLAVGGTGGIQYGVSMGYHFSNLIYGGITHLFSGSGESLTREYYELYGQNGMTSSSVVNGQKDTIEMRISPFSSVGLYISAAYLISKGDGDHTVYDVRTRTIGSNDYVTGLDVTVKEKPISSLAFGGGINQVLGNGISFGAGYLLALKHNQSDVTVIATNPNISTGDIDAFKQQISDEHRTLSMLYLTIGYNF